MQTKIVMIDGEERTVPYPTDLPSIYRIALAYVNQYSPLPPPYDTDPEYVTAHALMSLVRNGGTGQGANARLAAIREVNERLYGKPATKVEASMDVVSNLDLSRLSEGELENLHQLLAAAAPEGENTNE